MRRTMVLLAVTMVALMVGSGVAWAEIITCPTGANGLCVGTNNNDTLNGTDLPDDMRGLKGNDTLNAKAEFDTLLGGRGNDTLKGEAGPDDLNGELGNDTLLGGPGDDSYIFANGWGKDRIADDAFEQAGERLSYTLVSTPLKMDLISSASRPEVQSGANTLNYGQNIVIGSIDGSSSNDDIAGTNGGDFLNGIQGNDSIRGRAQGDTLLGSDGKDTLIGGEGGDDIRGEKGDDVIRADDNSVTDLFSCGPGQDTAFFDQGEIAPASCEVKRPQ